MGKCSCGRQASECHNPETIWYPQRTICYATRDQIAAQAKHADVHDEQHQFHDGTETVWAAERSDSTPFHFEAGVTIYVTSVDHDPDGQFLLPPQRRHREVNSDEETPATVGVGST